MYVYTYNTCVCVCVCVCMYILYPFIHLTNIYRESLYTRHCPRCWGYSCAPVSMVPTSEGWSPSPQPPILCPWSPRSTPPPTLLWVSRQTFTGKAVFSSSHSSSEGHCLPKCPSGFTRRFHVKHLMRELPERASQVSLGHSRSLKRPTPREGPNDAGLGVHPSQPQTWVGTNPLLWRFSS